MGKEIGVSDWFVITQDQIDTFAKLTGDDLWIHVDPERAKTGMPDYRITHRGTGLNYGSNRVRYVSPAQVGSRIRLKQSITAAEPVENGMKITSECVIEIEGKTRPALVAEFLMVVYDN
ncbi:enoyl-CoA hydratase 1 [Mycobacteroides abscessus subsp. abscessus]|nr:enoyl-CoA hydratase 1 [Mycobacteroides abscessus subsp. abscessus]